MVNSKLIEYIKTEEAQGFTAHQLHDFLLKKNYSEEEIDEAITYANKKNITTSEQQEQFENALEGIKRRNSTLVFFLTFFTAGLYAIPWFMVTSAELKKHQKQSPSSLRGLLLLLPPIILGILLAKLRGVYILFSLVPLTHIIVTFLVFKPFAKALTRLTKGNPGSLVAFALLAPPLGVLAFQEELNRRAHYK